MKDNAREIFANNLQQLLDRNGKDQVDIVRDLNYKQPTVSDWVRGKKYPRPDKMEELADYFGVSMSDLTDEKPAQNRGAVLTRQPSTEALEVAYAYDEAGPKDQLIVRTVLSIEEHKEVHLPLVARGGVTIQPTREADPEKLKRLV